MRRLILAAAFMASGALVVPAATPASAGCGTTYGVPGVVYVNDSPLAWIYVEYNGNSTLEHGGTSLTLGEAAPCVDSDTPDLLII